jgi:hypothetical protein
VIGIDLARGSAHHRPVHWNERQDTASEIMGLTDARELERLANRPQHRRARGWPRPGSIGRWIGYALLAALVGGWLITVLTRVF